MKKVRMLMLVGALLSLLAFSNAFADVVVVSYDDTWSNFAPPDGCLPDNCNSLIKNGDFEAWSNGEPDNWYIKDNPFNVTKLGWEVTHLSQVDLTRYGTGHNNGMGLFIRNIGGDGPQYAYASQELDLIPSAGYYVVNVSYSAFYDNGSVPYNSVAWYGIGDSADPASVGLWREIYPDRVTCQNSAQNCEYGGRHETIQIAPGQHFHVRVGQKFNILNSWTTWIFDDFNIVPAGGADSTPATAGFYNWVWEDANGNFNTHLIRWDRNAPR